MPELRKKQGGKNDASEMEERLVQEKCEIQMDTVWEGQQDSKTQELHKRKQQILVSKRVTLKGQLGVKGRCSCQEDRSEGEMKSRSLT